MKSIEKVAIILIILAVVTIFFSTFSNFFIIHIFSSHYITYINMQTRILSGIFLIFGMLVRIGVAIWLFSLAKRHQAQPWIWCLFGLVFGLIAAILFYLIRIYEGSNPKLNDEKT